VRWIEPLDRASLPHTSQVVGLQIAQAPVPACTPAALRVEVVWQPHVRAYVPVRVFVWVGVCVCAGACVCVCVWLQW
jgi:hypothetical protein